MWGMGAGGGFVRYFCVGSAFGGSFGGLPDVVVSRVGFVECAGVAAGDGGKGD